MNKLLKLTATVAIGVISMLNTACGASTTQADINQVKTYLRDERNIIPDSIGVVVVYDTSGSMNNGIATSSGVAAKSEVAKNAVKNTMEMVKSFSTGSNSVFVGVVTFRDTLPIFKADAGVANTVNRFISKQSITGGTPLGPAIINAGKILLASSAEKLHMVVVTDGAADDSADPLRSASPLAGKINLHFVAVGMDERVLGEIKSISATVVEAKSESQLREKLNDIFANKVLVEE